MHCKKQDGYIDEQRCFRVCFRAYSIYFIGLENQLSFDTPIFIENYGSYVAEQKRCRCRTTFFPNEKSLMEYI